MHRIVLPKQLLSFTQQIHPIHSIRPQTHVWMCFGPFCNCEQSCAKRLTHVLLMHKFVLPKQLLSFKQQMRPIHSIRPITLVWMCFGQYRYFAKSCAKRLPYVL